MRIAILTVIACLNYFDPQAMPACAQSFQNLDFESANVPDLPLDQYGGFVPVEDALPGWSAYLGTELQTEIPHNYSSLGSTLISIIGPESRFSIEGRYYLDFYAGVDANDATTPLSASISQMGVVPGDARSLMFKTQGFVTMDGPFRFVVSLGGE